MQWGDAAAPAGTRRQSSGYAAGQMHRRCPGCRAHPAWWRPTPPAATRTGTPRRPDRGLHPRIRANNAASGATPPGGGPWPTPLNWASPHPTPAHRTGQLPPHRPVPLIGEQRQRQHEQHHHPRRQQPRARGGLRSVAGSDTEAPVLMSFLVDRLLQELPHPRITPRRCPHWPLREVPPLRRPDRARHSYLGLG